MSGRASDLGSKAPSSRGAQRLGDSERLAALDGAGLTGPGLAATLAQMTKLASEVIGVPVALVSLVGDDRQTFVGSHGLPEPWGTRGWTGLSHSFCKLVVEDDAPLVIADARENPRTRDILAVRDLGVIAYAGTPLRDPAGRVLGSVCAIDDKPHVWTATELRLLDQFNALAAALIADRAGCSSEARAQQEMMAETAVLARRLQRALLPSHPGTDTTGGFISAYQSGSRRLLLGGDFADVYPHPDGAVGFVLGDICGHGPESAAMAIGLRASWAALETAQPPLEQLIAQLNLIARREARGDRSMFATVVLGRLSPDPGGSRGLRAGHPCPIDLETCREVTLPPGPIIGVFDDVTWESAPLPDRREGVLFYTDGLVEGFAAPGQTERWGTERLLVAIARERARTRELEGLPQRLIRDATEANGDELSDDVAILILR